MVSLLHVGYAVSVVVIIHFFFFPLVTIHFSSTDKTLHGNRKMKAGTSHYPNYEGSIVLSTEGTGVPIIPILIPPVLPASCTLLQLRYWGAPVIAEMGLFMFCLFHL